MDTLVTVIVELVKKVSKHFVNAAKALMRVIEQEVEATLQRILEEIQDALEGKIRFSNLFAK